MGRLSLSEEGEVLLSVEEGLRVVGVGVRQLVTYFDPETLGITKHPHLWNERLGLTEFSLSRHGAC